jgi:hypothetical protein
MSCTIVTKPDGTRMIVCRRGDRAPIIDREAMPAPPDSPWQLGRRVKHKKYGPGTITSRNQEAIRVQFDGGHTGVFMLAFVGNGMEVMP